VWRHPNASDAAVQDYLIGLLGGLVWPYQIAVRPPFAAGEAAKMQSTEVPIDPVAVAA
jgi:hypothetical protein